MLHMSKYIGREEVLARNVPLLNCRWNDVVHLLPLHPKKIYAKQVSLGLLKSVPNYAFYEIDIHSLDAEQAVVFFKDAPGDEHIRVQWLKDVELDELQEVPGAATMYYKSLIGTDEAPFDYQFVPHVLYRGEIDVSGAKTITI